MKLRVLAYAAATTPLVVAAFVAGVVFERYRAQPPVAERMPDAASVTAGPVASSKTQEPVRKTATADLQTRGPAAPEPDELPRDKNLAKALEAIEAAWRAASDGEQLLAVKIGTCYGARFIRRGASIRTEAKGPEAHMKPSEISIQITGMMSANLPNGKSTCFKSIGEVLTASRQKSEDLAPLDATLTYKVSGTELRLERITSEPGWFGTAVSDNVRLNLLSWKAVGIQTIGALPTDASPRR